MKTSYLFQKAQSQLIDVRILIQAEGWDKDPDYIKRDKGRFSSNKGSTTKEFDSKSNNKSKFPGEVEYLEQMSRIEGLTKKDMDYMQKAYESLSLQEMKEYEDFVNSPAVKQMQEDFSSAMQSVSTDATKVYDDVIKKVKKEPEPKEHLNAIQQAIKDHPTAAKVGAVGLGVVATLALTSMALSGVFGVLGVATIMRGKSLVKKSAAIETLRKKALAEAKSAEEIKEGLRVSREARTVARKAEEEAGDARFEVKLHGLNIIERSLEGGLLGLGAIALNNEVSKNEKEKAATRFENQLDLKAFSGGEKQKQDFTKQIVEAVDKASKDFNKAIQK